MTSRTLWFSLGLVVLISLGESSAANPTPTPAPMKSKTSRVGPEVCRDMASAACNSLTAWQDLDDGTGTTSTTRDSQIYLQVEEAARQRFREKLNSSTVFRRMSLESTRSSLSPRCRESSLPLSSECFDEVASATFGLIWNWAVENRRPTSNSRVQAVFQWMLSGEARELKDFVTNLYRTKANTYANDQRARQILESIRALMIRRLDRVPMSPEQRRWYANRLRSVRYDSSGCRSNGYQEMVSDNAYYFANNNSIQICAGLFANGTSAYTLSFVIAHELAHAIGPGNYISPNWVLPQNMTREEFERQHPFGRVLSCLRGPRSGSAQILVRPGAGNRNYRESRVAISEAIYREQANFHDQVGEAFADWMALEVVPDYIQNRHPNQSPEASRLGYVNVYKKLCMGSDDSVHNNSAARSSMAIANPEVRQAMGCTGSSPRVYCDARGPQTPPPRSRPVRSNR